MFKQENRLKKDTDIKRVVKSGKSVFDAACGVKYLRNNLSITRFAVVVGLKVSKSAVVRNKIRRQYREIVRAAMTDIKPGFDVILLTSKKTIDLEYGEKKTRLLSVFKKARLL